MELLKIDWLEMEMVKEMSNLEITACQVIISNLINELLGENIYTYDTVTTIYSDKRLYVEDVIPTMEYDGIDETETIECLFMVNREDVLVRTTNNEEEKNYYRLTNVNDYL